LSQTQNNDVIIKSDDVIFFMFLVYF